MYYKYMQLDKIVHESTCKMCGTNNGILTAPHVLTRRSPAHRHIILDLLIVAVLSIRCKKGRRNTVWCKEMTQQLDGRCGEVAVALKAIYQPTLSEGGF